MTQLKPKRLAIDWAIFRSAFNRDVNYEAYSQSTYLDLETGEISWVYKEDKHAMRDMNIPEEDNRDIREQIEAAPSRYLEIPGLQHRDHHEILQEFLGSEWTDDAEAWSKASGAYFGSIGGWKKAVADEEIIQAFYAFRDQHTEQMAEEFLRKHGIEPQWE